MSDIIGSITAAQERGMSVRPRVGGFPFLAESLRQAGVREYQFDVPSASAVLVTDAGTVLQPGTALRSQMTVVPPFDRDAVRESLRADQAGETTFPEFVESTFRAGVVRYTVDLDERTCTYLGVRGESYIEHYPVVELPDSARAGSSRE